MRTPSDGFNARKHLWASKLKVVRIVILIIGCISIVDHVLSNGYLFRELYGAVQPTINEHIGIVTIIVIVIFYAIVEYECKKKIDTHREIILETKRQTDRYFFDGVDSERSRISEFMTDVCTMLAMQSDITRIRSHTESIVREESAFQNMLKRMVPYSKYDPADAPDQELLEFEHVSLRVENLSDLLRRVDNSYHLFRDNDNPTLEIDMAVAGETENEFDDRFSASARIRYRKHAALLRHVTDNVKTYENKLSTSVDAIRSKLASRYYVPE